MAYEFHLPDIGEGLVEATVVRWLVDVGEEVPMDAPMVEIETDKAVVEVPAPRGGVLLHRGAEEGAVIQVDDLLAVIGAPGEEWSPAARPEPGLGESVEGEAAPIVGTLEDAATSGIEAVPAARKRARDLGVDLESITGSGPGGRILVEDVEAAAGADGRRVERVALSPTRRRIAEHMERSWREIPHVVTYGSADAEPLLAARAAAGKPPLEALLVARTVPVLREFPEFNATLDGGELVIRHYYDIGVAVDTAEGLMVAVVRGADALDVSYLGAEIERLAEAVRSRSAAAEEVRGATFTISNIGAVGGAYGTPIIPFGTTAILSVGRADPAPAVDGDRVVVARRFPLSLAYDHRVIDGARGRRFLAGIVSALERP